jgi:hypothetical protein
MRRDQEESDMREHDTMADAEFFGLDGDAAKRLKAMAPDVLSALTVALDGFYDKLEITPPWRRWWQRREAPGG